jgi:hypothetical protein
MAGLLQSYEPMNLISPKKLRQKPSLTKRIVFGTMLAGIVVVACELISWAGLNLTDKLFSMQRLRLKQQQIAEGRSVSDGASESLHPYLGWVHNPQLARPEKYSAGDIPVNWLGFKDDSESVCHRAADTYIVGIAGGSVAWGFSWEAQDVLRQKLSAHPALKGRRIQFVRMALPGYKQPQQLMVYNFLLTLGAEFDAIVNMDGYNETVLTMRENAELDTAISYPRAWHARIISGSDPRVSAEAARLLYLRGQRQQMARSILTSRFGWSGTCNLIWHIRDQIAFGELTDLGIAVGNSKRHSFTTHGPTNRFSGAELEPEIAAMWQRCSRQMHNLCKANGTLYLHVLQPNQYVLNSKPMGAAERRVCYSEEEGSAVFVRSMFPKLQELGLALEAEGVEFSDQTMVFANVEKPLYVDCWCHFNAEGHGLLGAAVADRLLQVLDKATAETMAGRH